MRIDNLSKCCKPRQFGNFATDLRPNNKKVRYKHYEEMDNDTLSVVCLTRACNKAQSSGKTKLNKAIPAIVTGLVGTSIALAQPGKLASKAARGLGFLMLLAGFDFFADKVSSVVGKMNSKNLNSTKEDNKKAAMRGIAAGVVLFGGAVAAILAGPKLMNKVLSGSNGVSKFISSEKDKLVNELNSSKLGKLVENKINPFLQKHKKIGIALSGLVPFGTIVAGAAATNSLDRSLSCDVKKRAMSNFVKAKLIQEEARNHFDKIDAKEI